MKRIIALLLAIMMLPIFTVVSQAAEPMTRQEFKDVLLGNQTTPGANSYQADLIRAYRNISKDQLDALRNCYNTVPTSAVKPLPSSAPAISPEEEQILTYGFIKLMTFPDWKNGTATDPKTWDNNIGDADIERAVDAFFTKITYGSVTDTPNAVLNKVAGGEMKKNALGAFVIDFQKNLRAIAAEESNFVNFIKAYQTAGAANYVDAIIPYVKTAAARALTKPAGDLLNVAKKAMLKNGMLSEVSGEIAEDSAFINLIVHAINTLKDHHADVMAVVMNTIMSGVIDAHVEVYSSVGASSPKKVEPNNFVATLEEKDSVYLKVVSNELKKLTEHNGITEASITPNFATWMDAAVVDKDDNLLTCATVTRESNMLKVTGVTAHDGAILKLYRDTNNIFEFNDATRHNDKELFMELNLNVISDGGGGGGGAPVTKRVEAPTITFEVDGAGNITVSLETATEGATIYYTTTGLSPTEKSQKYEGPFQVPDGTTIKAFAVKPGYIDSYVSTDTIKLDEALKPTLTGEHIAYVHGRDTGNFDAEDNVTRGEVAAIFSRLLVKKMVFKDNSTSKFTDVVEGAWHTPYIKYLTNVNIINGYEDGTFRPDAPITRAELATVASRFFDLEQGSVNVFSDVSDSHWAKPYIDSAVIKGWILGYEDGTFKPDQAIKRSETVTIVNRMLNRVADKTYIAEHYDEVLDYPDLDESYWAYYEILEASNWHDHKVTNNKEIWTDIFYQERFNAS